MFVFISVQIVTVYDVITIPIYFYYQKPWEKLELAAEPRAQRTDPKNPYSPWTRIKKPVCTIIEGCSSLSQLFEKAVGKFESNRSFGYRKILDECEEVMPSGRLFKKYVLDDEYTWLTYAQMKQHVDLLASGFLQQGMLYFITIC